MCVRQLAYDLITGKFHQVFAKSAKKNLFINGSNLMFTCQHLAIFHSDRTTKMLYTCTDKIKSLT